MVEKWTAELPRPLASPRTVYVYLPEAAKKDSEARFPVMYMFDGHNVFFDEDATYGKSWGMAEYLDSTETPLIVVAVDCDHGPNNGRLCEYSPFTFEDEKLGFVRGRGKNFMDWVVDELKPLIDAQYPTLPEREATFVAGSSMGGLMSLFAVVQYNDVFARAACLSPSVWFATRRLDKLLRDAAVRPDTVIYMDYGSREMANHPNMQKQFSSVTARLLEKGVWLTSRIVPNGDHCEACWEEQLPICINTLMYQRD